MLSLQPEPFFITFALYDCKENRKVSEDFHYDPNHEILREYLQTSPGVTSAHVSGHSTGDRAQPVANGVNGSATAARSRNSVEVLSSGVKPDWLKYPTRVRHIRP